MRSEGSRAIVPLAELYAPIAEDLRASQRILADELVCDQGHISDLCQHVSQFHGKLLRPALLLLVGKACGELRPAHHTLAAVVELVHVATLVHDDVLDEADIRRRAATVNRLWGNERAVLMGDFLFSHAFHLCSELESQYASRMIGKISITVCEGEMMQVANRGNLDLTEDEYYDIISRKTGALIEACCQLGAWASDADAETVRRMRAFGRSIGVAFQIVDDVLDLMGDESEVGKSLGRDLCEGELTLPLIHYLRSRTTTQRKELAAVLRGESAACCREVAAMLRDSESVAYAQNVAAERVEAAREAILHLPPTDARESLLAMADFVVARRQ